MDRNLGATQVATSSSAHLAYGGMYQWGRKNDGHQNINWTSGTSGTAVNGTTGTKADVPSNALFILSSGDWRVNSNDNLWSGVAAVNNPCPAGFRLPTYTELSAEFVANNITDRQTAFSSPFKFPASGTRNGTNGTLGNMGSNGGIWSSTLSGGFSQFHYFTPSSAGNIDNERAAGLSIRCIKN